MSDVIVPETPTAFDRAEARIVAAGGVHRANGEETDQFPVTHRFTPGLYIREIFMPAGTIVMSKIHKYEHPFIISKGRCDVMTEEGEWVQYEAPHTGITMPGTRRLLVMHEDTVWTTFHVTDLTDPKEIEDEIVLNYKNPLLQPLLEAREKARVAA